MSSPSPRTATPTPTEPLQDHVIICGLGNLGYRIYSQLDVIGVELVVVDAAPDPGFAAEVAEGGDRLLRADARQAHVLARAGLATARALITTFDDDLANLEVALHVAQTRPDLPVVMRFFNIDLAAGIQAALPNLRVLSLSALASPAFVLAATDPYVRNAMILDGQELAVDEFTVTRAGTLERLTFGKVITLAWQRGDAPAHIFPPSNQPLQPGDRVTVFGPESELGTLPTLMEQPRPPARRRVRNPGRLVGRIRALAGNLDRALYLTLGLLAAVILLSMGIFAVAKGLSLLDALFLVFTVISATGVGGAGVSNDPAWLKFYVIGLMILGTAVLTIIYAFVTNYIVSVKLSGLLGQQPVQMTDHIVLCGLGTVGYRVVEGLVARGERVAVLENNPNNRFLPLVRAHGRAVQVVIGDARVRDSLVLVNVAGARCVVTSTSDDMANIQTALNARQINPQIRVILRMFDQAVAQRVARTFHYEVALSASALAAPTFVAAALGQTVLQAFEIDGQQLAVARLVVPPSTTPARPLGGLLGELPVRVLYYTPAGGEPRYRPGSALLLTAGDALVVIAREAALREISKRIHQS